MHTAPVRFSSEVSFSRLLKGAIAGLVATAPMSISMLTGVAVWVGSYLGWLPAMDILTPATRHPWRRNLMMIAAHMIWGVALGQAMRKLTANEAK